MQLLAVALLFGELLVSPVYGQMGQLPKLAATGVITGIVVDPDGHCISGALVSVAASEKQFKASAVADTDGRFTLDKLEGDDSYQLTITASGFGQWKSPALALGSGQHLDLASIVLKISVVETTVTAVSAEQLAAEQIRREEKQRVLGVIPNFYVSYDREAVPLPTSLKFKLAIRAETDVVTFTGAALRAGIDQAADTPAFSQGAKGYGQRFGVAYAGGASDILIGAAVLPSLLHQDPRYFYNGEGTRKQRLNRALKSVLFTRGDNGTTQFNYSGIGGDLASAALTNAYYPATNRGPYLFFTNWGILTGSRIVNVLTQEFGFIHFTTHAPPQ